MLLLSQFARGTVAFLLVGLLILADLGNRLLGGLGLFQHLGIDM